MKVFVTGGAGFIGSHVVDAYVVGGHEVVVVDDMSTGLEENLNPKAKLIKLDVTDRGLDEIVESEKPELINHHAAHIHVGKSVEDPGFDAGVNILGTINLMQAARKAGTVKKVIFASTGGAMYGNKQTPFDESMMPQPLSPYGVSKRSAELYLNFYKEQWGIGYVALRYANVYGPRQNPYGEAGVVAIFCERLLSGQQPVINGDGKQTRDYVYVSDVVKANMLAGNLGVTGEINIGTTRETSVNDIYELVRAKVDKDVEARHGPPRPGEQQTSSLKFDKAREQLGWEPTMELSRGIEETVKFFQEKSDRR